MQEPHAQREAFLASLQRKTCSRGNSDLDGLSIWPSHSSGGEREVLKNTGTKSTQAKHTEMETSAQISAETARSKQSLLDNTYSAQRTALTTPETKDLVMNSPPSDKGPSASRATDGALCAGTRRGNVIFDDQMG